MLFDTSLVCARNFVGIFAELLFGNLSIKNLLYSPNSACSVRVLADLLEDRWREVTPVPPVVALKNIEKH